MPERKEQPDLEQVYREHSRLVYRFLLSRCGDAELAEELTQETFYRAVRHADRFDGSCRMSTWLCGIARNVLREQRPRPEEELAEDSVSLPAAEREALAGLSRLELLQRLHGLGEPAREIIYLRSFGGLSFREIGQVLGQSENWARVNFYRAKERLKKEMDEDEK
ncbi:MAG: sigma-70 family RNA polymerase sigma factor [Firmicutes bacterium]|nr:sigma-70 family RNA polymerase sigma factor [Bacillota bacterium]